MIPKNTTLKQTPLFGRQQKKLHKKDRSELDEAIKAILKNPKLGQQKKGDLADVRVYKFQTGNQKKLLAYKLKVTKSINNIILVAYGTHENFYTDLKKYSKK